MEENKREMRGKRRGQVEGWVGGSAEQGTGGWRGEGGRGVIKESFSLSFFWHFVMIQCSLFILFV